MNNGIIFIDDPYVSRTKTHFHNIRQMWCSEQKYISKQFSSLEREKPTRVLFGALKTLAAMRESINTGHSETGRTSHTAVRLVKLHHHDWVVLFVLLILDRVLARLDPFNRFIGEYMLDDLRYPMKENTVPFWAVPVISIIFPLIFIISIYLKKKNLYDMHHAVLGLLYSVLLSALITDGVKDAVGRPRPDFFWRCFPDGHAVFKKVTGEVACHGDRTTISEGHKSFPSGHAASSFSGLGFFALYLAGKIRIFDHKGHIFKLAIVFLPLAVATYVGLSRVNDYKHHWQDVFAGALLGLSVATFCYRQFFPPLYDENCMHPYSAQPLSREAQNPVSQSSIPVNGTVADVELGRIEHPSN